MNIILCPGSAENQKFKRWDSNKFLNLANRFIIKNYSVSILLGPEEVHLSNIFKDVDLILSPTFAQIKSIAEKSDLIICNDSFLLHFFCFCETKVLALYGPTNPNRTLPQSAFKISSKTPSKTMPCWGSKDYGNCDNGRCSCFDGLEAEDVFIKSQKILKNNILKSQ